MSYERECEISANESHRVATLLQEMLDAANARITSLESELTASLAGHKLAFDATAAACRERDEARAQKAQLMKDFEEQVGRKQDALQLVVEKIARITSLEAELAEAQARIAKFGLLEENLESYKRQWGSHYAGEVETKCADILAIGHRLAEAVGLEEYTPQTVADAVVARITSLEASIETAWGIIANAGGGNWDKETPEWNEAAMRWREENVGPMYARKRAKTQSPPPSAPTSDPKPHVSSGTVAQFEEKLREAVAADFRQFDIDSLTPERGYLTPIDNVRALIEAEFSTHHLKNVSSGTVAKFVCALTLGMGIGKREGWQSWTQQGLPEPEFMRLGTEAIAAWKEEVKS